MPAYIGSLVGPSGGLFYARDAQGIATVSSTDGVNWLVTDATVAAGLSVTAKSVPGNAKLSFTAVTDGDLTGLFIFERFFWNGFEHHSFHHAARFNKFVDASPMNGFL
jgi:hypothetical protein